MSQKQGMPTVLTTGRHPTAACTAMGCTSPLPLAKDVYFDATQGCKFMTGQPVTFYGPTLRLAPLRPQNEAPVPYNMVVVQLVVSMSDRMAPPSSYHAGTFAIRPVVPWEPPRSQLNLKPRHPATPPQLQRRLSAS